MGYGTVLIAGSNPSDTGVFDSVLEVDWGNVRIFGPGAVTNGGSSLKTISSSQRVVTINDAGRPVALDNPTPITLIIPTGATEYLPIGSEYHYIQRRAGGNISVSAQPGITLLSPSGTTTKGPGSSVRLTKITTTIWSVSGDLS